MLTDYTCGVAEPSGPRMQAAYWTEDWVSRTRTRPGDSTASNALHALQSLSSRTAASAFAAAASAAVLLWAATSSHPDRILLWFEALAAAVTLVMVFVLQHTQTRQQTAVQRKLDEVLHALPNADDGLMNLESASTDDLAAAEQRHAALRDSARP